MSDLELCPISGNRVMPIIDLGRQPIFMGTTADNLASDVFHEMSWGATSAGIVHLITRVPLDVLYAKSHNSGLIGKVWLDHHYKFSEFIARFRPAQICEIGGGHGILCDNYASHTNFDKWEIFEPNAKKSNNKRVRIINKLFTETTKLKEIDCVVHSHLFEHLYDHPSILKSIHTSLPTEGLMIFSVPNMTKMIQNGYINALNFEHVTYLPEDLIEYLLVRYGFEIKEKKYYLNDHSIFYCCQKVEPKLVKTYNSPENIALVKKFFRGQFEEIKRINVILESITDDCNIYLFGAHIFSQFYVSNGLKTSKIKSIIDNDKSKQSNRLYGTNLLVEAPKIISEVRNPVVILKTGAYNFEITQQLRKLNSSVTIID